MFLLFIFLTACKNEKKENVITKSSKKKHEVVMRFNPEDFLKWSKTKVSIESVTNNTDIVYNISRTTNTEPSYLSSGFIPVKYASEYKLSVNVRKGTYSNFFGLRIMGEYPDRVDAVYDLNKGIVVGYKTAQDFENPKATIENLSNGWYKCTVIAEVAADNIRIIMGATDSEMKISSWEGVTKEKGDVNFMPSSMVLEKEIF